MLLITVIFLGVYLAGFVLLLRRVRRDPPRNGAWFYIPLVLWAVAGAIFFTTALFQLGVAFFSLATFLLLSLFIGIPLFLSLALLFLWAPLTIPLDLEQPGWRRVMEYIYGYISGLPKPSWVVSDGVAEMRIEGNAHDGNGPGLVITEPHTVVTFSDGSRIRGVGGPGVLFTERGQEVISVLDLREQVRPNKVECLTRDGIRVLVPFTPIFRIEPTGESVELGKPWPYRRPAALTALFSQEVDPTGKTPLDASHSNPWDDLPSRTATRLVQQTIARYRLDELYATTEPDRFPRSSIAKGIRERLAQEMLPKGIKITAGGIGNSIMPVDPAVIKQRVETWKAAWVRKIVENNGHIQADRLRQLERVRSTARTEFLLTMVRQVEEMQSSEENLSKKLIALRLLETLDDIARGPQVESLLPSSALSLLENLRQRLGGEG